MGEVDLQRWCERARELGADDAVPIGAADVVVAQWVRMKCLYGCDETGIRRTCPPGGAPSVDETRRVLDAFRNALLLRVGPIEGREKSTAESLRINKTALALERELFLAGCHKALMFGAGPCERCDACVRGQECPTPEKARPSMEACGIDVFSTVRAAGWTIHAVKDYAMPYSFFALVLID
jgi:predicted metal-binding protein